MVEEPKHRLQVEKLLLAEVLIYKRRVAPEEYMKPMATDVLYEMKDKLNEDTHAEQIPDLSVVKGAGGSWFREVYGGVAKAGGFVVDESLTERGAHLAQAMLTQTPEFRLAVESLIQRVRDEEGK